MKGLRYSIACAIAALISTTSFAQNDITVYNDNLGKDEVIPLPEGMLDAEIDSMMKDWSSKAYLTYDGTNCTSTDDIITFSPDEYKYRLSILPNVIDMPYNQVVQKFIDQYIGRLRRSVAMMLGASNFYTPIFEDALESYQLPLELKYLPVIESALNPNATSRMGAGGLWQFMPTTGKQYGLEINSLIDERRDPVKASYAAAHMLKDLYDIFGDWTLVIASYNCGPGNVSKAIKRAGGEKDYWKISTYLPAETRGYVPAFIAANYIMNYYCDHNICPADAKLPIGTDTIVVSRNVDMERISTLCNIPLEELKALNPQYRTTRIPGAGRKCILRMPLEGINAFIESGDSIYTDASGVSADAMLIAQNLDNTPKAKSRTSSRGSRTVTVRKGDTLGAIARRNHTTVAALRRANGIKGSNIRPGQKLRLK